MGILDQTVGMFLIGTFLSVFLGGITTTQAFYYYVNFWRTDKRVYKAIVVGLFILDTFHTITCMITIYHWLVTNYGKPEELFFTPLSFNIEPALTGLVTFICQTFFAYRIFILSGRKKVVSGVIFLLSWVQMGFAFGGTGQIYVENCDVRRFTEWVGGVATWLIAAAVADVLITISLVYYLRKAAGSEYQRSTLLVNRIIAHTVETNGATMIFAVVDAILFVTMPTLGFHVVPQFMLIKLYHTSVLVSLNSRKSLSEYRTGADAALNVDTTQPSSNGLAPTASTIAVKVPAVAHSESTRTFESEETMAREVRKGAGVHFHRHAMIRLHSKEGEDEKSVDEPQPFTQTQSGETVVDDSLPYQAK